MQYRRLGRSEFVVSVVGVGTWQFGGEWGKKFRTREVRKILDEARSLDINLLDTAECYGDHTSEALIGKAIAAHRDHWIVATKFGHRFNGFLNRTPAYSVSDMISQLEASLTALRTDRIDLYQVHGVSEETCRDDALWTALDKQKQLGKIRAIGVSILFDPLPLDRPEVQVAQLVYNRLNQKASEDMLPRCQEKQFGVLARVPLASGLLSGKYNPGQKWRRKDVRNRIDDAEINEMLRKVEIIRTTEAPDHIPLSTWALSWCLRHPAVSAVIPGCKSVEQVRANAAAAYVDIGEKGHPLAIASNAESGAVKVSGSA